MPDDLRDLEARLDALGRSLTAAECAGTPVELVAAVRLRARFAQARRWSLRLAAAAALLALGAILSSRLVPAIPRSVPSSVPIATVDRPADGAPTPNAHTLGALSAMNRGVGADYLRLPRETTGGPPEERLRISDGWKAAARSAD